jgi:acetylornithine deacetylase/succinyl-diaminopimelate desuccinylase-like protein
MTELADALERVASDRDGALEALVDVCAIPSVSALPEHAPDVRRAAEWAADRLERLGMDVEVADSGSGYPVISAEWLGRPGAPTLGIYNHYDVQPVDPVELWTSPPFEPTVRDGALFARGASDDKGALVAGIKAAEYALQAGGPPVNLRFLYEGEEEITGTSLADFLADNADRLSMDYTLIGDGIFEKPGVPLILTGLRGILQVAITAVGPAADLHSGLYGGVAPNPLNTLAHVLSALKGRDGRITIPGFYDGVRTPDPAELEEWKALGVDDDSIVAEIGGSATEGEEGYSALERMWSRPTLDVHGIVGGHMQEGTKTVIPSRAVAKLSMRLVPDQDPLTIFESLREYVAQLGTPGVSLTVEELGHGRPAVFGVDHAGVLAAQRAFEAAYGRKALLKRMGASVPVSAAFQSLDTKLIVAGFSLPDDGLHAPDERFGIGQFHSATETILRLMYELAADA